MELMDEDEKIKYDVKQPTNVHLMKLLNDRNLERKRFLEFEEKVLEPAKKITLELQAKSLELGRRIAERKAKLILVNSGQRISTEIDR